MNVFANFDEIPSMILQDIKEILQDIEETRLYGHTVGRTFGRLDGLSDGQRENSIPCVWGGGGGVITSLFLTTAFQVAKTFDRCAK